MIKTLSVLSNISLLIETQEEKSSTKENVKIAVGLKDYLALLEIASQRINNKDFKKALENRDQLTNILQLINEDIAIARGNSPGSDGKKKTCYVDIRTHSRKYRDIAEVLIVLEKRIDEYKELTAQIIKHSSTLRETIGAHNLVEYNSEKIGQFIADIKPDYNTLEGELYRLGGIGGSEVATIMKTHPEAQKARDYYKRLLKKKSGIEEEEEKPEEPSFSINRGNLWEKSILMNYADQNPEKNIAECSVAWTGKGEYSYYRARFDGLELDQNNNPIGIIEIKTGIIEEQWGITNEWDSIPANYRCQAIWYAKNAGLSKATIIALLDDYDLREYTIDMNSLRVLQEWKLMQEQVQEFWNEVLKNRELIKNKINPFETRPRNGFSKTLNMKSAAEKIAAYSGEDFNNIYTIVKKEFSLIKEKDKAYSIEQIQETLTKIYASHDPRTRNKPIIGIDIETNGFSEKSGRIIETGIVVSYPDGEQKTEFASVHGISPLVEEGLGIGDSTVHRITPQQIIGKPLFEDEENQQKILSLLKQGVMVAHNASFEKKWLVVNLDGFAEMLDNNELEILDTMQLCWNLILDTDNNKLSTFAESNGIAYEGAHNAITDTIIMMKALRNFQEGLFSHKKFVEQKVSNEERESARIQGLENDFNR